MGVGCAGSYRLDDAPGTATSAAAPLRVLTLSWERQLVDHGLLAYRPQEWATPSLQAEGVLYVGSSGGKFYAFDLASGRELWTIETQGPIGSTPWYDERTKVVYFGGDDGNMYAVDAVAGRVKWTYSTQGIIRRAPAFSEGFLLFATSEGRIYALDADSGKWRWQYDREMPEGFTIHGHAGVVVRGNTAYTGFADGTLVALRAYSGDVIWTRSLRAEQEAEQERFVDIDSTPVLVGDTLLASSYSGGVFALSADSGSVRWRYPLEGANSVVAHGGRVYVTAPRAGMVALDMEGRLLWRQAIASGIPSRPVGHGPYLFVAGTEAGLYAVAAGRGTLLQYLEPGHGISAEPGVGQGRLGVLTNWGRLYTFRLLKHR
jgi:outer membrane protein assembly factor BamB